MFGRTNFTNRYWLGLVPLAIAVALPAWQSRLRYGWLEMATGDLFWLAVLIWAVCVVVAIRRFRWWWLLLTAPIVLYPVVSFGMLALTCAKGNCL